MKAVVVHRHGGPEVLSYEEVPDPKPGHGQVLVKVKACALNHLDIWNRTGIRGRHPVNMPLPIVLGSDVSGTVASLGPGVTGISVGDKIILAPASSCGRCYWCFRGMDNFCTGYGSMSDRRVGGGYAEYVVAPEADIIPMPSNLTFEEAATFPLVLLTIYPMVVTKGQVRPGEDVLVHSAGSGIGSMAIQLAKAFGARVIATGGSEEKLTLGKKLGADEVINYNTQDMVEEVKRLTDGKGVELVIEHVGGDVFLKSIEALARGGRLVTCGATTGWDVNINIHYLHGKRANLLFHVMGTKWELMEALKFVEKGQIKPVVSHVLPLKEAAEAHRLLEGRKNLGKIVLVPG